MEAETTTIVLDLTPATESLLREEAARYGQDPAEYAKAIVEDKLRPIARPFYATATKEEWRQAFLEWIDSHRDIVALSLPAEAFRREYIYEDRGV
jgi:hypothetical protein